MNDKEFMLLAIEFAYRAEEEGEVPVGAVITHRGELLSGGYNKQIKTSDPTAHAEIEVIRSAASMLNNYRLSGTTLYVTLEPCPMCAGAIVHSRVERVVFGAFDENTGAAGSVFEILGNKKLNHQPMVVGGVEKGSCAKILHDFFAKRRVRSYV